MILLANNDIRCAKYAAQLYHEGLTKAILITGKSSNASKNLTQEPDWRTFARYLFDNNVPPNSILVENKATNTIENILFSEKKLLSLDITYSSIIFVTVPWLCRRFSAIFEKNWPNSGSYKSLFTCPSYDIEEFSNDNTGTLADAIILMMCTIKRMSSDITKHLQGQINVPSDIIDAYDILLSSKQYLTHFEKETTLINYAFDYDAPYVIYK